MTCGYQKTLKVIKSAGFIEAYLKFQAEQRK